MKIGVDYYPEHWDRNLWGKDAQLMHEAGVKIVRLAEFAWSKLEPREGLFDFAWLDEAVAHFSSRGMEVVLCTPTNCPPLWLYERYPESLQVGRDGKRTSPGVRGHRCYNSPVFRKFAERIVNQMAEHYAGNHHIVAWQIDNEVDASFCCCEVCTEKFRQWTKNKYKDLDALNQAYKNDVWSGRYSQWSQLMPPLGDRPLTQYNPAYTLDFHRFASDSTIEYVRLQQGLLRRWFPAVPITTNTWFCEHMPDFYRLFETLDFCSYDNYPTTSIPRDGYFSHAFHLDLIRGVKQDNFWIMEQLSGSMGCWMPMQRTPSPGMIKGYALQALAHGADTVVHFRWRTAIGGAEMHWHGIFDHSNVPGRRFREFTELCQTAAELRQVKGTRIHSKVALLCGFDSEYAFKLQLQADGMYYFQQLMAYHDAFTRFGLNVDIIDQNASLEKYRIVIAPTMYVRSRQAVEQLHRFARAGGIVLLTNRSGVKDESNNGIMALLPTDYADMTGATVEEYNPIGPDIEHVRMQGSRYEITHWCDILNKGNAEVIAAYEDSFYAGKPAITCNRYGQGWVYYVGTVGKKPLCRALAERLLQKAHLPYHADLPENVEVTVREGTNVKFTFLFNCDEIDKQFVFQGESVSLSPFEMKIMETTLS